MTNEVEEVELSDKTLEKVIALIHRHTGMTLAPNRKSMVQGRLRPRIRELKLKNYDDYVTYLGTHPEEVQKFVNVMTTNETYFYRTPRIWEGLEKEYLPNWYKNNRGRTFLAWSAAASTGEEACTLGSLFQNFKENNPGFAYQIVGTDISAHVLAHANQGIYKGRPIDMLKKYRPEYFTKYFVEVKSDEFSLKPEIRQTIKFQIHNLFERLKYPHEFDLVLLRNVLIYFNEADQEKVLFNISLSMKPEAQLIIGESESITRLNTPFKYESPLIYKHTPGAKKQAS